VKIRSSREMPCNWDADVHRWWKGTDKKRADYRKWLSPHFVLDLVYNLVFKFAVEK
jgi:hypothetical protein